MQGIGRAQYSMCFAGRIFVTGGPLGARGYRWGRVDVVDVKFGSRAARQWEGKLLGSAVAASHDAWDSREWAERDWWLWCGRGCDSVKLEIRWWRLNRGIRWRYNGNGHIG